MQELNSILDSIKPIALDVGGLLRENFNKPHQEVTKASAIDIATESDQQAEEHIIGAMLKLYPEHHLVGEEGGGHGAPRDKAKYLWFIDPIDGTTNFAGGIPHFCVSIAMTNTEREPLLGVIYDPMRDELFAAAHREGATLNGKPIAVSQAKSLVEAVVGSGFGYDKHTNPNDNTAQWTAFVKRVRGVRRFGAAALDAAWVAAGRLDAYWERSLNPWDVMAGAIIVEEAGGKVTDYRGGARPQDDDDGQYLLSNGHIHQAMIDVLVDSYGWQA